jgi:hypothetical protein
MHVACLSFNPLVTGHKVCGLVQVAVLDLQVKLARQEVWQLFSTDREG